MDSSQSSQKMTNEWTTTWMDRSEPPTLRTRERERGGGEIVVSNVCGLERKSCNCNKAALVYRHSD
jgi:hypothetical protein